MCTALSHFQAVDVTAIPVEAAEALLLWHDPWASARVFGGGLYALICLRHLVFGARRGRCCLCPAYGVQISPYEAAYNLPAACCCKVAYVVSMLTNTSKAAISMCYAKRGYAGCCTLCAWHKGPLATAK